MKTILLLIIAVGIGVWLDKEGYISTPAAVITTTTAHGMPVMQKSSCLHIKDTTFYMCI
jgi:hypothetical protein